MKHSSITIAPTALAFALSALTSHAQDTDPPLMPDGSGTDRHFLFDIAVIESADSGLPTSAAFNFDALLHGELSDGTPLSWVNYRFHTHGTVALDSDVNTRPLVAETQVYASYHPWQITDLSGEVDMIPDDAPPIISEQAAFSPGFDFGINARYETSQTFDDRNGVLSAFARISHLNINNPWAAFPSLYGSIDLVLPDETTALNSDTDPHGRFFAAADWLIRFDFISGDIGFLENLGFHAAAQYSQDFGNSGTDEDDAFGGLAELIYTIDTGFRGVSTPTNPLSLFVRYTAGRVEPIPEEEQTLLFGIRKSL